MNNISSSIVIPNIELSYRGKVRDIYDLGDRLIIVASDRVSAFDVVFSDILLNKGEILTSIANHWFQKVFSDIPNHIIETDVRKFPAPFCNYSTQLQKRSVLVHKAKRINFECIVRGYIMGSAWKDYQKTQSVSGIQLPQNLKLADRLKEPIFTPSTKSDVGHDQTITFSLLKESLGTKLATQLKEKSIYLYKKAHEFLEPRGFLLLDTKLEFGYLGDELILIDEIFTPDSSRFCTVDNWKTSIENSQTPDSFDKQIIRNYLETLDWNKQPPAPPLPKDILDQTLQRYELIKEKIQCIF